MNNYVWERIYDDCWLWLNKYVLLMHWLLDNVSLMHYVLYLLGLTINILLRINWLLLVHRLLRITWSLGVDRLLGIHLRWLLILIWISWLWVLRSILLGRVHWRCSILSRLTVLWQGRITLLWVLSRLTILRLWIVMMMLFCCCCCYLVSRR